MSERRRGRERLDSAHGERVAPDERERARLCERYRPQLLASGKRGLLDLLDRAGDRDAADLAPAEPAGPDARYVVRERYRPDGAAAELYLIAHRAEVSGQGKRRSRGHSEAHRPQLLDALIYRDALQIIAAQKRCRAYLFESWGSAELQNSRAAERLGPNRGEPARLPKGNALQI